MQLQDVLFSQGFGTRRICAGLIQQGHVAVAGQIETDATAEFDTAELKFSVDGIQWPYRAKAYDLSFEWYFAEDALVSLALFKKDIASFVQIVRSSGTFSSNPLGLPDSVALAACGSAIPDPATCVSG